MVYTFSYNDGNCGDSFEYPTEAEAIRAASRMWDHLTKRERAQFKRERGAWFYVVDGSIEDDIAESAHEIRDYTEPVYKIESTAGDGKVLIFDDVQEAENAAYSIWEGLPASERARMVESRDDGAVFRVVKGRRYDDDVDCVELDLLDVEDELPPEEVSADMQIRMSGNSMVLRISKQAKLLGVNNGDVVNVTIRRKD